MKKDNFVNRVMLLMIPLSIIFLVVYGIKFLFEDIHYDYCDNENIKIEKVEFNNKKYTIKQYSRDCGATTKTVWNIKISEGYIQKIIFKTFLEDNVKNINIEKNKIIITVKTLDKDKVFDYVDGKVFDFDISYEIKEWE